LSSFDELVKKVDHLTLRVEQLEQLKVTQSTQLDNCLQSVIAALLFVLTYFVPVVCWCNFANCRTSIKIAFTESLVLFAVT